jgi:diguanylate cyclase (GGDEF)-like protein
MSAASPDSMKRSRSPRDVWASLLPTAGAALALSAATWVPALALGGRPAAGLLVVAVLAAAAAAGHRPLGGATLGLGAVALPAALVLSSPVSAASLAAAAFLLADLFHRLVRVNPAVQLPERRRPLRSLETSGRVGLAALAAGGTWAALAARRPGAGLPAIGLAAAAVYLVLFAGLEIADRKIRRPDVPLPLGPTFWPLLLDALGWTVGVAVALAGRAAGWRTGGLLLAALGALAAEAARHDLRSDILEDRAKSLEQVGRAVEKMVGSGREIAAVAEQIRSECGNVLPFHWFQFELLAPSRPHQSWWAGLRGPLAVGAPEPERNPPALPGVHRRTPWQILERQLRSDGVVLGRLRLWCDPRRLAPEDLELLDRLLPQMAASLHRSLLDREASEDPLTGVAVRRVLERRLQEVHARCLDEGGPMAVILCDLDHFKRINDTYGHGAGDDALVLVAGTLDGERREGDLCCRYGGEEFTLLLDRTTGETALAIAERLRERVSALEFTAGGKRVPLTLSAGVAAFPELHVKTASELLLFADGALYEAKRRGRNRCLLDLGQGRYLSPQGTVETAEDAPPVQEPPRIFA